ncbi:hypothetical protein HK100_003258 [Physocladia obscura]|uniref:Inositol-1-monophosphatase n=1 Tax=Physocladia obscura TaxID=109957 RepID=A0AAD5XL86_9FUNG|nr:hypothetical protein HK100_003258 [Physocladia obscura]
MSENESLFDVFLATALEAARLAAPIIKAAFTNRTLQGTLELKTNTADIVTQTVAFRSNANKTKQTSQDKAVEALVMAHIRAKHPTHSFIGEETYNSSTSLTNNPTWVIDPVDGTTNFVHGFPFVCISIALVVGKEPVVGVVLNPILEETFYARRGGVGAFLVDSTHATHELPLHKARSKPWPGFERALLATEYGYDRGEQLDSKLSAITRILKSPTRGVRSIGSAALSACYVANGSLDAYWEAGVHMWDVAAATVIVRESGGGVANFVPVFLEDGKETLDLAQRKFIFVRAVEGGEKKVNEILELIRSNLDPVEYQAD